MAESFFDLFSQDRADALEVAAGRVGRPAELLEKDIWVVWTLLPEFAEVEGDPIPSSRSQADRITARIRRKLPDWVGTAPRDALLEAAERAGLGGVKVRAEGTNLILEYPHSVSPASDYVRPEVLVEFGARSSGEPAGAREVTCDAAPYLEEVSFPVASPRVMAVERTFWEKASAAHVYCLQQRLRSERFARHWYDLAQLERTGFAEEALRSRDIASQVADHKQRFFRENGRDGEPISVLGGVGALTLAAKHRVELFEQGERSACVTWVAHRIGTPNANQWDTPAYCAASDFGRHSRFNSRLDSAQSRR